MPSRLVLALVLAVLPFIGLVARSVGSGQTFTIVIRMAATRSGVLELYPDSGGGYRPDSRQAQAAHASDEPRDYRVQLPGGIYSSLRIDPGNGPGVYRFEGLTLLDPSGAVIETLALADLIPAHHLTLVERGEHRLVVECPPDGFDPQLIYVPASPLRLMPSLRSIGSLARWYLLYVAVAFAGLWAAQLAAGRAAPVASRGLEAIGRAAAASPQIAVVTAALVATVVAMYPVLFLGRSLVSPNNGGAWMLYDQPPYVPSSSDIEIENVRSTDIGAMMLALVPYTMVQREALAAGELPLWNRYNGNGKALWGQGQSFLLDPLHWLTLLGPDPAPGWDLKFAAHRLVLAWGVGVAALTASGAWLPAAIAASMTPFAGVFAFRFNHPAAFTITYGPWILAGWFLLARATTTRQRAGAGVLLALASLLVLFASPPKEGVVMQIVAHAIGLLGLVLQHGASRALLRGLGFAVAAGAAAVLIAAPHWLVFLQTLDESITHYDNAAAYFASRPFAGGMLLGPLKDGLPLPSLHLLALPFLVAAVLTPALLVRHRLLLACVLGSAAAIAIAFGALPAAVFTSLPLLANIHSVHYIFLTVVTVPLLVGSAAGAEALLRGSFGRTALATVGTVLVTAWVFDDIGGATALSRLQGWLVFAALAGAVLVPVTLLAAVRGFPRVLPIAAAGALSLLLLLPGGEHLETGIPALDTLLVQPRIRVDLAMRSPAVDAIHAAAGDPARVIGVGELLFPGAQALYGLESIGGPDALFLREADELASVGYTAPRSWAVFFQQADLPRAATLLDMMNVGYLLARFDEAQATGRSLPMKGPDLVSAIPRTTAWPRAFFVDRVSTYATPEELVAQARAAGRPLASIQLGDATAAALTRGLPAGTADAIPATGYRLTTNTTTFRVQAPGAGAVVLSESYMADDFVATLNGAPVPYFRVNHAFKGMAIPGEGEWEVRFEYRPKNWTLTLAAAAIGLLMLLALTAVALKPERTWVDARRRP